MRTIFSPNYSDSNPYIANVISILNNLGIETYDFKDIKKGKIKVSEIEIANLNWYDNFNSKSLIKTIFDTIKRVAVITYLKINDVEIFYTFHNKTAHDGFHPAFNRYLHNYLIRKSNKVLLLNEKSRQYIVNAIGEAKAKEKCFFVGHPLYHNETIYGPKSSKELIFLFFGAIRPYKNVELLINAWSTAKIDNAKLIIVGKPFNSEYKKSIESLCQGKSDIKLILEFVPEEQLTSLIAASDIIVAPLQKTSSMNSSTLMKAVCSGKNIVIPAIDMASDFGLENMFSYDYNDENSHMEELEKELKVAAETYFKYPQMYENMTNRLHQNVLFNYSDEAIKDRYHKVYYEMRKHRKKI